MFSLKSIIFTILSTWALLVSALPTEVQPDMNMNMETDMDIKMARSTSGDLTHYEPGLGACGQVHTANEAIVSIDQWTYGNDPNPNNSKQCGRRIRVSYGGKSAVVTVVDKCMGCKVGDLDLSPSVFLALTGNLGLGRVRGTWDWI